MSEGLWFGLMSVIGIGCCNECDGMVIVAILGGGISHGLTFIDVVVQEHTIDRRQGMEGASGECKVLRIDKEGKAE